MKTSGVIMTTFLAFGLVVHGCSKDDAATTNTQPPANTLSASSTAVVVGSGQSRNVTISGGTPAYVISSPPNAALATARLDSANTASPILVITGAVTVATGSTSVVVRDNSSPVKQSSISISKQ